MRRTKRGGWPYGQPPNVPFELNKDSPQAKGLVLWGPTLGYPGGGVLRDRSGYGNDCAFPGGGADPVWITSVQGRVLEFDGVDDRIDPPDISGYFSVEATLVMWLKLANNIPAANQTGWVDLGTSGSSSHYPWIDGDIYTDIFRNDRINIGAGLVDKSEWHLVAVTNKPGANGYKVYQEDGDEVELNGDGQPLRYLFYNRPMILEGVAKIKCNYSL